MPVVLRLSKHLALACPLRVMTIDHPRRRLDEDGDRLSSTYIDFFFANGAVIMPGFDDPTTRRPARPWRGCSPDARSSSCS